MYSIQAVPPIHIVVKNGRVTLKGAVGNQSDKQRAGMAANGRAGRFLGYKRSSSKSLGGFLASSGRFR